MKLIVKFPRPLIVILLALCACQGGRIPCPEIETVKLHRSFRTSPASLSAKVDPEAEAGTQRSKESRPAATRYIQNVSVEEWDCPRPGKKKYLPKSVKENIRNNRKKVESDMKKNHQQADSLSTR